MCTTDCFTVLDYTKSQYCINVLFYFVQCDYLRSQMKTLHGPVESQKDVKPKNTRHLIITPSMHN